MVFHTRACEPNVIPAQRSGWQGQFLCAFLLLWGLGGLPLGIGIFVL